jgi:hypothetical protein
VTPSGGSWLSASPNGSTPGSVTVSANPAGLAAGVYNGSVAVSSAGAANSPQIVSVTFTVGAQLSVPSGGITFNYQIGSNPPASASVIVSSTGAPLAITAMPSTSSGGNWLSVTPTTGTTQITLTVSASPTGLVVGTYNGAITISSPNASNSPVSVSVVLNVTGQPSFSVMPGSLSFQFQSGGSSPPSQALSVASSGAPLNYTVTTAIVSGATQWLSATPPSGSTPGTITVNANPAGLNPGTYSGTVTITSAGAANGPQNIPVTFTVGSISTSVSSLSFSFNGTQPLPQCFLVSSTPPGLSFTVSTSSSGQWLTVDTFTAITPANLCASVNPQGLQPGPYSGSVTITVSGGGGVTVPVSLNVSQSPIMATPSSLSFSYSLCSSSPPSQSVYLDAGGFPTNFSISVTSQGNWLSVNPTGGVTPTYINVSVSPASLSGGSYSGNITVTASGSPNPLQIPVSLTVGSSCTLFVSPMTLQFSAQPGSNPPPQGITVSSNNDPQGFTVSSFTFGTGNWLSVSPTSGSTTSTVNVLIDISSLAQGNYFGTVTVTGSSAGVGSQTVSVSLAVGPPGTSGGSPVISALSPNTLSAASQPLNLTIIGGGFVNGAVVQWTQSGQTTTLSPQFIDQGTLSVQIPGSLLSTAGSAQVVVVNPNGNSSAAATVLIANSSPNLAITELSPSAVVAGSGSFTLVLSGKGFTSASTVQWNGATLTSTFINSGELIINVNSSLVRTAGGATIVISDSGQYSPPVTFTISAPLSITFTDQRVTTVAPAPVGGTCTAPQATTAFVTSNNRVYLYFSAKVTVSDTLTSDWLAPDGNVTAGFFWNPFTGSTCFTGSSLGIANLPATRLGLWQARVFDNGTLLFTVPFTVDVPGGPGSSSQYTLTQVADGGGWRTTFNLGNPSSTAVSYQVQLRDDQGNPFVLTAGNQTGSSLSGTLAPGASVTLASSGSSSLNQGIAKVTASAPLVVGGIFSSSSPGRADIEAAVPALVRPLQSFVLPFDNTGGKSTGMALANTGGAPATASLAIIAESGASINTDSMSLDGNSKTEFVLTDRYPQANGMRGTVVISTAAPVLAALGLRVQPNGAFGGLPLYAADATAKVISRQILSHVIDGSGWQSTITIVNLDPQPAPYQLHIFDQNGQPLTLTLNGTTAATFTGTIPPMSEVTLLSAGSPANLSQGWADLISAQRIRAQVIFDQFTARQLVSEAVVPAMADGQGDIVALFDNTRGLTTGIAVANTGGAPAVVRVVVRAETGLTVDTRNMNLDVGAKTSFALTDLIAGSAGMRGMVELSAQTGSITVLALRFNGATLTPIPVTPVSSGSAVTQ